MFEIRFYSARGCRSEERTLSTTLGAHAVFTVYCPPPTVHHCEDVSAVEDPRGNTLPRGRCHFALVSSLHGRLRETHPQAADLADEHLRHWLAGSIAPDGLRIFAKLGKFGTHFYAEDQKETWGKAVSGMFEHHPDLSDPRKLSDRDIVLILGYISHLTVDEAFRDAITYQTHALGDDFRPTVRGLWSMVDTLPIHYQDADGSIGEFDRADHVGFIQCRAVSDFLALSRPWASVEDPWAIEQVFLTMRKWRGSVEEAKRKWEEDLERARPLLDEERASRFVELALDYGDREITRYLAGEYARP